MNDNQQIEEVKEWKEKKRWSERSAVMWFRDTEKSGKVFATVSAFTMSVAIYVIAQGFRTGFTFDLIWSWGSLIVGFAGGLGIPAVQEDGMRKGFIQFLKNVTFDKYRKDNESLIDNINNKDFQREFISNDNKKVLKELKEHEEERQIESLTAQLHLLKIDLPLIKRKRKYKKAKKRIESLETQLNQLKENGINIYKLNFKPLKPDDIFNFSNNKKLNGRDSYIDNSSFIQRKGNLYARIYMPIIIIIVQGSAMGIINENKTSVFGTTLVFALILMYTWYRAYTKHIELKEEIAIPAEINKNTLLKQATEEYKTWQPISLIEEKEEKEKEEENE